MTAAPPPAVVLLSGGLDSATCLAIAQADGFAPRAISFRYGQRHKVELQAAAVIAANAEIEHVIVDIDLWAFGGSALTADIEVPKHADIAELDADNSEDIPITYVPARNTIFLSIALAFAEVRGAFDIFIGVNALDYSGYPDCRPEYIEAYERMANLATKSAVQPGPGEETCDEGTSVEGTSERREPEEPRIRIHTPLIAMTKAEIIRLGLKLGVDYGATTSCYDPIVSHRAADGWLACGRCDSCLLRRKGFNDAGLTDPIRYADASGSARP